MQRARHRKAAVLDLHLLPAAVLRGVVADQAKRVPHAQRLGGADVARRNRRHAHRGEGGPVGRARGEERQHVCSARGATGYAEPPPSRAHAQRTTPSARGARGRSRPRPRRGRRSARHGGEDGGGGCPRQKGESGQWLVGRLRCLRDRAANHNCIMIFVDIHFLLASLASRTVGAPTVERCRESREGCRLDWRFGPTRALRAPAEHRLPIRLNCLVNHLEVREFGTAPLTEPSHQEPRHAGILHRPAPPRAPLPSSDPPLTRLQHRLSAARTCAAQKPAGPVELEPG